LIIAEELAPPAVMGLLSQRGDSKVKIAAIHPPEFGHWRKAMLEDIAVATDGRVVARDLGGKVAEASAEDLGGARQVRISANRTLIIGGEGRPEAVAARREQVRRQYDAAPENVERDKFKERLAKLSGGTAMILAGGATPVAQKRIAQLIEDAINATRAAMEEGVVAGGGISLMQTAPMLDRIIDKLEGDSKKGAQLVRQALSTPTPEMGTASTRAAGAMSTCSRRGSSIRSRSVTARFATPGRSPRSSSRPRR
jgi:chaperonin GroEL